MKTHTVLPMAGGFPPKKTLPFTIMVHNGPKTAKHFRRMSTNRWSFLFLPFKNSKFLEDRILPAYEMFS